MMAYTFFLYGCLTMLGWTEHTVATEGTDYKCWLHQSGLVVYQQ
jgi:hypothetical protein